MDARLLQLNRDVVHPDLQQARAEASAAVSAVRAVSAGAPPAAPAPPLYAQPHAPQTAGLRAFTAVGMKLPEIKLFSGSPDGSVKELLYQLEARFGLMAHSEPDKSVSDFVKITLAVANLTGNALEWLKVQELDPNVNWSYPLFKQRLEAEYVPYMDDLRNLSAYKAINKAGY